MTVENKPVATETKSGSKGTAAKKTGEKPVSVNKDGSPRKKPERRVYAPLNLSEIQVTEVKTADTMRAFKRSRGVRDPQQVLFDDLVRKAHTRWVEAGSPESWTESATGYKLRLPAEQYDTAVMHIRRAGEFFDVSIRFGSRKDDGNYAELVFIAKDKSVKEEGIEDGETSESGAEG